MNTDNNRHIMVIGTDTGVGKTVGSLLLMKYWYAQGITPRYYKPLQTGCKDVYDIDSDAEFIYTHVQQLHNADPREAVGLIYPNPKAPYFAARNVGLSIDFHNILDCLQRLSQSHKLLISEPAGGLMVPITESHMVIDLLQKSLAEPILIARAGLGTINHTILSIEALTKRNIELSGIVFLDGDEQETPQDTIAENCEAVTMCTGYEVAGVIPYVSDFTGPCEQFYPIFDKIFQPKNSGRL